jgi:hypothetical protein
MAQQQQTSVAVAFAHCRPSKSSVDTLRPSGAMLGLAPAGSLSQTRTPSLLGQLRERGVVRHDMWALMLVNGHEGVFSLGGSSAHVIDAVERQTRDELNRLGELERMQAATAAAEAATAAAAAAAAAATTTTGRKPSNVSLADKGPEKRHERRDAKRLKGDTGAAVDGTTAAWSWSKVQGAAGWWQILMQGVWVDGRRALKNQPVILDVSDFTQATPIVLPSVFSFRPSLSSPLLSLSRLWTYGAR